MRGRALFAAALLLGVLTGCQVSINIGSGGESPTPTPLAASPVTSEASPRPGPSPSPTPSPISTPHQTEAPVAARTIAPTPTPVPAPPSPTPPPPSPTATPGVAGRSTSSPGATSRLSPTPTPGFVTGRSTVQDPLGDASDDAGAGPPVDLPVDLRTVTLESDGVRLQMTFEAAVPISETLPPGAELLYHVYFEVEHGWSLIMRGTSAGWEIWATDGVQSIDVPNAEGDWSSGRFVVWVPWAWIPFVAPEEFTWWVWADWYEGDWHWFDSTDKVRFSS